MVLLKSTRENLIWRKTLYLHTAECPWKIYYREGSKTPVAAMSRKHWVAESWLSTCQLEDLSLSIQSHRLLGKVQNKISSCELPGRGKRHPFLENKLSKNAKTARKKSNKRETDKGVGGSRAFWISKYIEELKNDTDVAGLYEPFIKKQHNRATQESFSEWEMT